MIVKALTDKLSSLPAVLQEYALTQDDQGKLDISVGKHYTVFAEMQNKYGFWYFVHTDKANVDTLWWMPASLYEVIDSTRPAMWTDKEDGDEVISTYSSLFDWRVHEGIIDGDRDALRILMTEVGKDATFPSQTQLDELNKGFLKQERIREYQEDVKLAKERGYQWPVKPSD